MLPAATRFSHSVQFSHSVVSDSLQPHESHHARPPCPSLTPGVHSDSCPLSQLCPTLSDYMDCSPPVSSAHEILQARILELVAMSSSRESSQPMDQTYISCTSLIAGDSLPLRHQGKLDSISFNIIPVIIYISHYPMEEELFF